MSRARPAERRPVVYLLPAVVGGGLGDIEEVLAAGRRLAAAGYPVRLYREPGRPLPRSVDGPWRWPSLRHVAAPVGGDRSAITVSAGWGVTAAPGRDEPLGRAGPWAEEGAAIEAAHGTDHVVHVSFEEFARTLTSAEQTVERWREGGVPWRTIARRRRGPGFAREAAAFRRAYRRFRGFGVPNVLPLFTTFRPSRAFAREFPEAVQTGPLWPDVAPRPPRRPPPRASRATTVLWYASPSSSPTIAPALVRGLGAGPAPVRLAVRAPRPWEAPGSGRVRWQWLPPQPPAAWSRAWTRADLAIVTGSRTLLEALARGGPFLYFNGVTGRGPAARRHRPEKIAALLDAWADLGVPARWRTDLGAFARGRDVAAVARRAAHDPGWRRGFPAGNPAAGFRPPFDDAGRVVVEVARRLAAEPGTSSPQVVDAIRREARAAEGAGRV